MKVYQIKHLKKGKDGRWEDESGITLCETDKKNLCDLLESETDWLEEGSTEAILITYVEMTEEELSKLVEFDGW